MAATKYTVNATTRNAVHTQRLAFGEFKKVVKYLNELQVSINGTMATGDWTVTRQDAVTLQIAKLNKEYMDEMSLQIGKSATKTGVYTAGFTKRMMDKASNVKFLLPSDSDIETKVLMAVMDMSPGIKPLTMQEAISQYGATKAAEINRALSDGIIIGLTKDEIITNIDSVINIARAQSEALVRTTTNSAANIGRMATMTENKEFLEGYEWISKLDDRTTDICNERDGNVYEFKLGNPTPPAHWNCRSQIAAALLPQYRAKK